MRTRVLPVLLSCVGAIYVGMVVQAGWIGDDAFITLRAADNFVHGYGLVSNPPERVLGLTNPLWALLLSLPLALGLGGYAAALTSGISVSAAAAAMVLLRTTPNRAAAIVAGAWLTLSASYIDYSTSGLENPLAHLLLALFFSAHFAGQLSPIRVSSFALAALIVLNRQDHALLIAPALVSSLFERGPLSLVRPFKPVVRAALIGLAPLAAWFGFALAYYGFLFPNTAYAKLNVQLPDGALLRQGVAYFAHTWHRDPITLVILALAPCQLAFDRSREALATAAGLALYSVYVLRIGGDFMSGRFFTAPFLVAAVWITARSLSRLRTWPLLALAFGSLSLLLWFPISYRAPRPSDCIIGASGIVSERHCYFEYMALRDNWGTGKYTRHPRWQRGITLRNGGRRVVASTNIGIMGYVAGPQVHIIDKMALTDPLLARIPYRSAHFRIGHFERALPAGYHKSVDTGVNQIEDQCIHAYYDLLAQVIHGPLFTSARIGAALELNFGRREGLLQTPCTARERRSPATM